jgi:crossover junction endodeoxyribonuclease RuvC
MRVFGIDCGTECTGYGIVEWDDTARNPQLVSLGAGGIRLPKKESLAQRLSLVYGELGVLIEAHRPDVVAIEEVFYSVNAKSALKLGHIRGVALLAAARAGLPIAEYAPLKIKSTVTGYGLAEKQQVQFMVARLLNLSVVPEPADAADALAIAICHIHHALTLAAQTAQSTGR